MRRELFRKEFKDILTSSEQRILPASTAMTFESHSDAGQGQIFPENRENTSDTEFWLKSPQQALPQTVLIKTYSLVQKTTMTHSLVVTTRYQNNSYTQRGNILHDLKKQKFIKTVELVKI